MLSILVKNQRSRNKAPKKNVPSPAERNRIQEERGFALLITLICSTLFMLLGLSLTFSSMTEFRTSTEFEAREKSLMVADAGFNLTQGIFRGNSLTSLLASAT
ncbi:MAG: hypothetical protein IH917_12715, partial [Acidobacteria bacterium]|nr:hypothetical protein [Acidobacteriota bacterium]